MKFWKWLLLIVLSIQNALLIALISKFNKSANNLYLAPSIMVCWVERVRLLFCFLSESLSGGGFGNIFQERIYNIVWLVVPAFLYTMQINLCHIAAKRHPPLIYQIFYKSKFLTAAGFSV